MGNEGISIRLDKSGRIGAGRQIKQIDRQAARNGRGFAFARQSYCTSTQAGLARETESVCVCVCWLSLIPRVFPSF